MSGWRLPAAFLRFTLNDILRFAQNDTQNDKNHLLSIVFIPAEPIIFLSLI